MSGLPPLRVAAAAALLVAGAALPAPAAGAGGADPGPAFSTSEASRRDALVCPSPLAGVPRDPVLLVPGTLLDPATNFDWNWQPALDAAGIPWCTVTLVDDALGDIQDSAEHVVHAIRTMAEESGRRVDVVGYSQGGMAPRWALRWWPDTRDLVDDLVGLAPSNHGSLTADGSCVLGCAPAIQQQRSGAAFIAVLNAGAETWPGIDYTVVYTVLDEVVTPNLDDSGSSALRTGDGAVANIALQDVCPASLAEHIAIGTYDPVAHALARDALDHDGPADAARLDPSVCLDPFMPGVDPLSFATDLAGFTAAVATRLAGQELTSEEPRLRCYVDDSCDDPAATPPVVDGGGGQGEDPGAAPEPERRLPSTGGGAPLGSAGVVALVALAALATRPRARMAP